MEITERRSLLFQSTIAASGTLSAEIDLNGANAGGLIYSNATNGTLSFQVSHKGDANGGVYQNLLGSGGAAVSMGPTGAAGAVDADVLKSLRGYRFVKIKMSIAQAGIVQLYLPAKA